MSLPRSAAGLTDGKSPSTTRSRISSRPSSSDKARASSREILKPLYSGGLCEAVTMTPAGYPYFPTAKESASVETMPTSTTSAPASRMPSMSAAARRGSRPACRDRRRRCLAGSSPLGARPISRASAGFSSFGTIPRTS